MPNGFSNTKKGAKLKGGMSGKKYDGSTKRSTFSGKNTYGGKVNDTTFAGPNSKPGKAFQTKTTPLPKMPKV